MDTTRFKGSILKPAASPKAKKSATSRSRTPVGARGREKSLKSIKSNKSRLSQRSSLSCISTKVKSAKKSTKHSRSVNQ